MGDGVPGPGTLLFQDERDPSARTTTTTPLNPITQQILGAAQGPITNFATNPPQPFSGDRVAGFTPFQVAGQNLGAAQALTGTQAASDAALRGLQFLLGPNLDPGANPALQNAINAATAPLFENLTESVLPAIRGGAITSGQFGGSRQALNESLATEATGRVAGETAANLANQGFQASLDAASRALAFAPSVGLAQVEPARVLSSIGFTQQQQEQAQINAAMQEFMEQQLFPFLAARDAGAFALGIPGISSVVEAGFQPGSSLLDRISGAPISNFARLGFI